LQVKAIWFALLHDYNLSYINPPPTFTAASQRLRVPSEILRGGRGTCIDLALLIAACLEFVDIKPVIFLLKRHALVGYWSSPRRLERFLDMSWLKPPLEGTSTPQPDAAQEREATESFAQVIPWEVDSSRYAEIKKAIDDGDLIPLETTFLTTRQQFDAAIGEAKRKLSDPAAFHFTLDIGLARSNGVTPLPVDLQREQ
jgi:hypothetical protein